MAAPKAKLRLGERLIEAGLLNQTQLDLALREQKRVGGYIGEILVDLGFVQTDIISSFLAKEAGSQPVNLAKIVIDKAVMQMVPLEISKRLRVVPLSLENGTLTVAMSDPFDVTAVDTVAMITGHKIAVLTCSERDILNCLEMQYSQGDDVERSIDELLAGDSGEGGSEKAGAFEANRGGDPPVIRLVDQIITRAVNNRASDIHFEPEEKIMRIRLRIDGILYQDVLIPKGMQSPVTARLKIMGDLDVAESRIPQDGRATLEVGRREINLRISSLPVAFGENIVLRILDSSLQILKLQALGMSDLDYKNFTAAVQRPYGIILVCGPTGSGKTSTLYAALGEISGMEDAVYTLEDPIEFRMPVIRQTQIKEEIGMTFATGLRALLRQDPDVILVGETRDTETAQLMVRAALTGHMVFSTLHTNDAASAIPRLIDMGVEPYLLPDSLCGILAQRLIRTICKNCKQPITGVEKVFADLKLEPPPGVPLQLFRGAGCLECKGTGYRGRLGVFEFMLVDKGFHDAIVGRAGAHVFAQLGRNNKMCTMFEDGLMKALQGHTTLEEVLRVTRLVTG